MGAQTSSERRLEELLRLGELCLDVLQQNQEHHSEVELLVGLLVELLVGVLVELLVGLLVVELLELLLEMPHTDRPDGRRSVSVLHLSLHPSPPSRRGPGSAGSVDACFLTVDH